MILVVGGAGYIGSHTNKLLNQNSLDTVVFDNLIYGHKKLVKWGKFFFGDLKKILNDSNVEIKEAMEETKKSKLAELDLLKKQVRALQKQRFGVEGDLFKKREELIQPIQEKIFKAIKSIAKDGNYSFVFDKANSSNILYAESKYDISNRVLKKMGYSSSK